MTFQDFLCQEYSLIISIVGTILGIIMSIVGETREKETVKKIGIILLVAFLICCVIMLQARYGNISSDNEYKTTTKLNSESTTLSNANNMIDYADKEFNSTTTFLADDTNNKAVEVEPITPKTLSIPSIESSNYTIKQNTILKLNGHIYEAGTYNDHTFSPSLSGIHRFEFSNVSDGTDFKLYIYNSGWERLQYSYDLDNGDGITISLKANNKYIIRVEQYKNTGSYTLNIGQPKPLVDISLYTSTSDSIQFTNQQNNYSFIPENSGTHRFEFSNVPDGTDFKLYIYNSGWEQIKYSYDLDNGDGITISLSKDKIYYIRVVQYKNLGSYTLNIGHKKKITTISGYTSVSDSIQYTGQTNDYAYSAKISGVHRFEFSNVPNGVDFKLYIYNPGWEQIKYAYDLDNGDGITISLIKDKIYYIRVEQYRSNGSYTLNIGNKKSIIKISESIGVSDSIQYTDQENDYSFFVTESGSYKFMLSNILNGTDFKMYIYNSGWEQIKYAYDMDAGDSIVVPLSSNEEYFIRVVYYRNFGKYNLSVSKQK